MFEIIEKKGQTYINLTKNDSCEISTCPFIDTNSDNKYNPDDDDKPIILGDNDYVLFCIASPSGKIYFKKILTKDDYNNENVLTMKLYPNDTINMQPFSYLFSFAYMPNKGGDCYTYATGIFNLLPVIATVKDLNDTFATDVKQPKDINESGDANGN